jgi:RNA recognition motif-containing protein
MSKKLFVGNIPYTATEDTIRDMFAKEGRNVSRVTVVTDRETGRSRGFAFVEMESEDDAKAAVAALNGTEFDGRTLRVDIAHDKPAGGGGGGGGGGGRGGRGGRGGGRGGDRGGRDRY